ncbi:NUDIX domain-containing protein [Candidatus Woesearchaeota archaeon]|nr:NUDIX domain-containing protein [Candidatus Woesearchaeota archaeon]
MTPEEMIDIVNDEDAIVGKATRKDVDEKALIHRTVYVIIVDYFGRFIVQKRPDSKDIFPGCWDLGMSETVLRSEPYEAAALRGLKEELGIDGYTVNELRHLFDVKYRSDSYNTNTRVFKLVYNGKIELHTGEVDEVRHASTSEVTELISNGVFALDGAMIFNKYTEKSE